METRTPSYTYKPGHVDVYGDIKRIEFKTNTNDGGHFFIDVEKNGEKLPFTCTDCLSTSKSLALGKLYLDGDMNGPQGLPGSANCQNQCEFVADDTNDHPNDGKFSIF